jgi:hypothetical protein
MMKLQLKLLNILLLAALTLSLSAQTIVLEYMKVAPGNENDYLEVEQAWKKIHEKRIEAGVVTGWQLWRNVYAGADDPYQYITINWYKDWAHSLAGTPEGFWEDYLAGLFSDEEANRLMEMTSTSRVLAKRQIAHQVMSAGAGSRYILVNQMKVKPDMGGAYVDFEREFSKPLQEEAIKRGQMSHWSVWQAWPYEDVYARYTTVDGFDSIEQMTMDGENLVPVVHPGLDMEETLKKMNSLRTQARVELWELVDSVFPESE